MPKSTTAKLHSTGQYAVAATKIADAIEHISVAREALDAASRDLSTLYGVSKQYKTIGDASNRLRDAYHQLDMMAAEADAHHGPVALDHEPRVIDRYRHAGCGTRAIAGGGRSKP